MPISHVVPENSKASFEEVVARPWSCDLKKNLKFLFSVLRVMAVALSNLLNKIALGSAALGVGTLLAGKAWCVGTRKRDLRVISVFES